MARRRAGSERQVELAYPALPSPGAQLLAYGLQGIRHHRLIRRTDAVANESGGELYLHVIDAARMISLISSALPPVLAAGKRRRKPDALFSFA
jgi:hypothetical protein